MWLNFVHWMYGHSATQLCSDSMVKFLYNGYISPRFGKYSHSNIPSKLNTCCSYYSSTSSNDSFMIIVSKVMNFMKHIKMFPN